MSINKRPGGPYVVPIKSDGTAAVEAGPRGQYTLAAGTWVFPIGGTGAANQSIHVQWDAAIAITGMYVEDCNMAEDEVSDYSTTNGDWLKEDPSTAYIATEGSGITVTNGTVALTAGAVGGAMFNIGNSGARRTRLTVVVGTQGKLRVGAHGKA